MSDGTRAAGAVAPASVRRVENGAGGAIDWRGAGDRLLAMTRSDLVRRLKQDHPDLPLTLLEAIVATMFATIAARLPSGGRAELRGFGSVSTRGREVRIRRNPKTGVVVRLGPDRTPRFAPRLKMRALLNPPDPWSASKA